MATDLSVDYSPGNSPMASDNHRLIVDIIAGGR